MPPSMDDSIKTMNMTEHVKVVDHQKYWLAWGSQGNGILFGAQQWHVLTEEDGKTKYESIHVLKGLTAQVVKRLMGKFVGDLESSVKEMSESLKRVCEST